MALTSNTLIRVADDHNYETFGGVVRAIEDLPEDPDIIAKLFEDIGLKGYVGSASECPLAQYAKAQTGGAGIGVRVSGCFLYLYGESWSLSFNLPIHLANFVSRFDCGKYPNITLTAPEG